MNENNLIFGIGVWNVSLGVESIVFWTEVSNSKLGISIIGLLLDCITGQES